MTTQRRAFVTEDQVQTTMTRKRRRAFVIFVGVATVLVFSVIVASLYDDTPKDHDWSPLLDTLHLDNARLIAADERIDGTLQSTERADVYSVQAAKGDMIFIAYESTNRNLRAVLTDKDGLAVATYYNYLESLDDTFPTRLIETALFEIPESGRYTLILMLETERDLDLPLSHRNIPYSFHYSVALPFSVDSPVVDILDNTNPQVFITEITSPKSLNFKVWTTSFALTQRIRYVQLSRTMYPPFRSAFPTFTNLHATGAASQGISQVDDILELMTTIELESEGRYWIVLTPLDNFEDIDGYTPDMQRRFELVIR